MQNSTPLQPLIQQEINRTNTRFSPILNTWILAAILIPTSTTLSVLILAFKYSRKVKSVSANITTTQAETLSQMKSLLSQEQSLTHTINSLLNESQENIQKLQNGKTTIDENGKN
ncbi:MAG: hypothetical protein WBA13_08560 [Microcoleaceae cyanobacterium]